MYNRILLKVLKTWLAALSSIVIAGPALAFSTSPALVGASCAGSPNTAKTSTSTSR